MPKETLKELEYELREVQGEVEILASLDMDTEEAEKALSTLKGRILKRQKRLTQLSPVSISAIAELTQWLESYKTKSLA